MLKTVGIIAEYNPFHTGHAYQIEYLRKLGFENIVVVQSGSCVQRGTPAIISKFVRAGVAVDNGADLVIELPFPYSSMSAEGFARSGVFLLKNMGVDAICFGSESGDKNTIFSIANFLLSEEYNISLKKYLGEKLPFPLAREKALTDHFKLDNNFLKASNDILAIEYVKACISFNFTPEIIPLKRQGASYNSLTPKDGFASASYLRKCIADFKWENLSSFIPSNGSESITKALDRGEYFTSDKDYQRAVIFTLKSKSIDFFMGLPDCNKELAYALYNALNTATTFDELFKLLPTKQYTKGRLNRVILYALLNVKQEIVPYYPPYIRLLATNKYKENLIKDIYKNSQIPISHSSKKIAEINEDCRNVSMWENNATDLFSLFCKISLPSGLDFTTKFIKK